MMKRNESVRKKRRVRFGRLAAGILALAVFSEPCRPFFDFSELFSMPMVQAAVKIKGTVAEKVKVKKKAGGTANVKDSEKRAISLAKGKSVTIKKTVTVSGKKWYLVKFTYKKASYSGYIRKSKVSLASGTKKSSPKKSSPTVSGRNMGTVDATFLNVRTGAGVSNAILTYQGENIGLEKGARVDVLKEDDGAEGLWYEVAFSYGGKTLKGYVSGDYIMLDREQEPEEEEEESLEAEEEPKKETEAQEEEPQKETEAQEEERQEETEAQEEQEPERIENPKKDPGTVTQASVMSEEEFEAAMEEQGFPESYKPYLRELHKAHPLWSFEAYQTGLDWGTVIKKQSKVGRNLVPNTKGVAWKSVEEGAYDWTKDSFIPFDGVTWVTASKKAVKYYMDPRNFLNETGIYQFELLSYHSGSQTKEGVEAILNNTPMAGEASYTYTDPETSEEKTITYVETFLAAAEKSGVSPYHLASRVRQEVVVSADSFSNSATGTYSGYEGYYNFFNIGASDSAGGGAVAKGLAYAKKTDSTYLLPWTSPYRSIVGGAVYIGNSYINKGQNTLYLEKFNVTPTLTYNHQYMTNVEAASSEAQRICAAYQEMGELPLTFSIPVYSGMPEEACAVPKKGKNPNNWLKSLKVSGYSITPTFQVSDPVGTVYSLIVDPSVDSIEISAEAVSSLADVSGIGEQALETGENLFTVTVTAENGDIREYGIKVVRNE